MSALAQTMVKPMVADPNHVSDTFANGPVNLNIANHHATLTFTNVRPDLKQAFEGQIKDYSALVVARVTMPLENLVQLRELLSHSIQSVPMPGSLLKQ